ncbi:MAG: hypothetical protein K9L84_02470 [Candidatus Omnitrophica bacterium]|nr:hypothetical protein [Candidatus Omnitrophota bacterium]MCF7893906.1 hypothetical protein [Candidatus Omnitrophota bacterium]
MKKKIFFIIVSFFLNITFIVYAQNKEEIISKAIDRFAKVKSFHFDKKTITGSFSVAKTVGALDYLSQKMQAETTSDGQLIKKVYSKDSKVYIYNAIADQWFKINKNNYRFEQGFNKEKLFIFFKKEAENNGFRLRLLKDLSGPASSFFVLESRVENQDKAKRYVLDNLDIFFGNNLKQKLKDQIGLFDSYLSLYTDNFLNLIWISKKDFIVKRRKKIYQQPVGSGSLVKIEEDIKYYDFNKAFRLKIPKAAKGAPTMPYFKK